MTTPNMGEILVQQAQEAERLRLLLLAYECETIQEFCEKLLERLNKFSELYKSSENLGFQWRRTPFLGFPRTPFLSVAENLLLY